MTGSEVSSRPTFKSITWAEPVVGPPPSFCPEKQNARSGKKGDSHLETAICQDIGQVKGCSDEHKQAPATDEKIESVGAEARPLKNRLRPRKVINPEPEVFITAVRPASRKASASRKRKAATASRLAAKKRKNVEGSLKQENREIDRPSGSCPLAGENAKKPIEIKEWD